MEKNISKTERIANELLIERYKPILVIQLSVSTTRNLSGKLKQFAEDISERTRYEVLIFPDEKETSVKIISICNTETTNIEEIKNYVYKKYENYRVDKGPFNQIKDRINDGKNER
jgi:hypothetical protein|tara:strand:- start:91 stop:435 length:345 start_codon:yes stop_codon:yes gene_type:complete